MARRRKKRKSKIALIVIGVILAIGALSAAGYKLKDILALEFALFGVLLALAIFLLIWNLPANKVKIGERRVANTL